MAVRLKLFVPLALLSLSLGASTGFSADSDVGTAAPPPPTPENTGEVPPSIVTAPPPPLSSGEATQGAPALPPPPSSAATAPAVPPAPSEQAPAPAPVASQAPPPVAEENPPAPPAETEPPPAPEVPPAPPEEAKAPAPEHHAPPVSQNVVKEDEILPGTEFENARPGWAVRFAYTPSALGGKDVTGGQLVYAKGFSLGMEYQPKFLQTIGVISFGPSIDVYPLFNPNVQSNPYTIYSYGGSIRYQAKFFHEQWVVPEVAYDFDKLNIRTITGSSGSMNLTGPEGGIYLLLNELEPSSAFEFYKDVGVLKSYLTGEVRSLNGSNTTVAVSGTSYYIGIRCEF